MQRLQELQILKLYSLNITYKHSKIKQKRAKYHFMNKAASIKTVKNKNGHRVPVFLKSRTTKKQFTATS